MSKSFKATWLGDEDPSAQIITIGGVRFIKGEPTDVPDDLEANGVKFADMIKGNPTFSVGKSADPVAADEPTDDEQSEAAEQGTEKAALKAELAKQGVVMKGNPSVETLRKKLAE